MAKHAIVAVLVCLYLQARFANAYDESDLDQTDLQCLKELGYDKSIVLNSYDEHDFIKEGNAQMNTFYACAWKKDDLMNDDGAIKAANLQKMIELKLQKMFPDHSGYRSYLAHASVEACKDVKGSDNGDTGVKIYNCVLKKIGEISEKTKPEDYQ